VGEDLGWVSGIQFSTFGSFVQLHGHSPVPISDAVSLLPTYTSAIQDGYTLVSNPNAPPWRCVWTIPYLFPFHFAVLHEQCLWWW
jgi:hypothetical protein